MISSLSGFFSPVSITIAESARELDLIVGVVVVVVLVQEIVFSLRTHVVPHRLTCLSVGLDWKNNKNEKEKKPKCQFCNAENELSA
jgi:hypothetical protein